MEIFKIDKEKEVLQHSNDGVDFMDLGVSRSEYTLLMQEVEKLKELNKETLPIYKSYNLTYNLTGNEKVKELIDEAGLELPTAATAFELFSNKLELTIKDLLSTYKDKTGKHFPYIINHIPIRFNVEGERVANYYNQEGMNTERLGGVTYPFSKDVEVSFNPLSPVPIVTRLITHFIPMFGFDVPNLYSYPKSFGNIFEGAAPSYIAAENGANEYSLTHMSEYLTTMTHPTVTTRMITVDGNRSHYYLYQNGVIISPVFKINDDLKNGVVDTSQMSSDFHINYWNNPTGVPSYLGDINAEILIFPKLEWYDTHTSEFKPAAIATIIPDNHVNNAAIYIRDMYVGLSELNHNERNSLRALLSEGSYVAIVDKRRELNLSFANIYNSEAKDMTYTTSNVGEYPHLYVISPIKLNTQEVLMLMEGYFPTGQAKAKYKITSHYNDMYEEMHMQEREEEVLVTFDNSVEELEVAEVDSFFGVGPKLYVHKIPMTYPELELSTGETVKGVSLLKVGPNALS